MKFFMGEKLVIEQPKKNISKEYKVFLENMRKFVYFCNYVLRLSVRLMGSTYSESQKCI